MLPQSTWKQSWIKSRPSPEQPFYLTVEGIAGYNFTHDITKFWLHPLEANLQFSSCLILHWKCSSLNYSPNSSALKDELIALHILLPKWLACVSDSVTCGTESRVYFARTKSLFCCLHALQAPKYFLARSDECTISWAVRTSLHKTGPAF